MTTFVRSCIKWFYTLFAIAAISLAVVVQAGRSLAPMLTDYPQLLSDYLSHKMNAKVSLQAISAEWVGLKPMVDVQKLRIVSQADEPIIALEHARLRLDLLGSLRHARLVWSVLQLNQVEMDFVQTQEGFWRIPGIPKRNETPDEQSVRPDALIDMALLSRRIEFLQSQLRFHFVSGDSTSLKSPLVRMENLDDFHRLSLQVDVDGKPNTLKLLAEGRGDPRQRETFSSKGYVEFNHFPTSEPIAATTALLLRGINAEVRSEGTLDARLWFSSRPQHEGFDVVGKLGIERLSLPLIGQKLALDSFTTDLVGHWLYTGQWQLALQDIGAKVNEQAIAKVSLAASADNFSAPVVLHMQQLDLQRLNHTLDGAGVLGTGRLREVMRQLNPEGELRNLQVAIPPANPKDWELQANLVQVGANAWQGVPALRKVDGFVHATQAGGFVDIDSRQGFSMHYSPTYDAPMEYQQAKGQVAWWLQPEHNQIYVNSGQLEFSNGDEHAKGYMWLALPWQHGTGDIDLYLQIGAEKLNASLYQKYTPAVLPHSLLEWLQKSIGPNNAGWVNQVGFLYRGTLNTPNHAARSHQLYVDLSHAQLNYHPEWPALEQIDGRLLVSNDEVFASVSGAKLFASDVAATEVSVIPNADGSGELLRVNGSVTGGAADGLRVLRESMLRRYLGASMDSWKMEGQLHTQLNIAVPLAAKGTGAAQQVDVDVDAPLFELGNLRLAMQNIAGRISYNDQRGLSSENLRATLFDQPVSAQLATHKQDELSQTLIDVQGEVDAKQLAKWSQRPEVLFLQGKIPYETHIQLNHRGAAVESEHLPYAQISVASQLAGVAVNLPAPYAKTAEQERALRFNMALYEQSSVLDIAYGDKLQTLLELDSGNDNRLVNLNVALDEPARLPGQPQFLVSGHLREFDLNAWRKVQQRYLDCMDQLALMSGKPANSAAQSFDGTVAGLPVRVAVALGQYQVGPLLLENIAVNAEPKPDAWKIQFSNNVVLGDAYLPNDSIRPLQINLQNLHLTSDLLGIKPPDTNVPDTNAPDQPTEVAPARGPSIDPRSLPFANVTVKLLFMDDHNYGSWSLQIRPNAEGVSFDNIHGSVRGVTVSGADDELAGAKMTWLLGDSGARTHFVGTLSAGDLGDVLRQWQKPDIIESTAASFRVDVSWAGDPQDFALKQLQGNMDIWMEKGRFKNNPNVGSDGFLRLMATLNFDSLARRLRLDFSDLYKSGLAYDQITGKVSFEAGTMTLTEPLLVATPSSRLQMAGKFDLEHEKMDTRLVATLPVVGNFTFFTALVTGLPAAAGIYVVSKLFKKQVDRATSLSYSIRGSWDNPTMSFERLFESEESLRNAGIKPEPPLRRKSGKLQPEPVPQKP